MEKIDRFVRYIALMILRIFHRDQDEKTVNTIMQFIKFCMVGITNTLISYGINVAILKILQPYNVSWDYVAGNVVAFILSVLWSFYWNNKYVFTEKQSKRSTWHALIKTYIAYGSTGIILTNILSYFWIDVVGISKYIAPLINLVITIPLNFLINKFWAFKE